MYKSFSCVYRPAVQRDDDVARPDPGGVGRRVVAHLRDDGALSDLRAEHVGDLRVILRLHAERAALTEPVAINWRMTSDARFDGIAKPMPLLPPRSRRSASDADKFAAQVHQRAAVPG